MSDKLPLLASDFAESQECTQPTKPLETDSEPVDPSVCDLEVPGESVTQPPPQPNATPSAGLPVREVVAHRTTQFARAEAFLGRPIEVAPLPGPGQPVDLQFVWELLRARSVDSVLQLLSRINAPASPETGLIKLRCRVALGDYQNASKDASRIANLRGEATPFEVRVLAAQLPFDMNPSVEGVQVLGQLQELSSRACSDTPVPLGGQGEHGHVTLREKLQVLRALSRVSHAVGYGNVAVSEMRKALLVAEAGTDAEEICVLRSLLGRHYAAAGETADAEIWFNLAHKSSDDSVLAQMDMGLLAVAAGRYADAKCHFQAAASSAHKAVGASASAEAVDDVVAAENNLAVCRLYLKELQQATEGLETLVQRDPVLYLTSSVVKNLVALYEFVPGAVSRRMVLQELVKALRLEDVDPKAFSPQPG